MSNTKSMAFIACSMMMSVVIHGMELEKLNEPCIPQDHIFVWLSKDHKYHEVTKFGTYFEHNILQKNDQKHKVYRAQLVIQKDKEGAEGKQYSLRTTQEVICNGTETTFKNLKKLERILLPTSFSQEQCDAIRYKLNSSFDRKKAVLAMDNDGNEYFITHIWDENRDNSKKVRVYSTEKHRAELVPVLNKKKMLLKIHTLEQEVTEFKKIAAQIQIAKDRFSAEKFQEGLDRRNRNIFIGNVMQYVSFAAVIALCVYAYQKINLQYQA